MATFQIKAHTTDDDTRATITTTTGKTRTTQTTTTTKIASATPITARLETGAPVPSNQQKQTNLRQRQRCRSGARVVTVCHNRRHHKQKQQSLPASHQHRQEKNFPTRRQTWESPTLSEKATTKTTPFDIFVDGETTAPHRCWIAANYILRKDSVFIFLTMLLVAAVVISENAVFAAQRDSFKPKDPNSISNNANTIPNGISPSSSSGNNGNGNTPGTGVGNANNINNGNTNSSSATITSTSSSFSTTTTTTTTITTFTAAATRGTGTGTATSMSASQTSSASSTSIASSSLQKASSNSVAASGINRNTIDIATTEDARNGPYFDKAASKNVTALLGKTAYLNCRVKNLGNKTMLLQVSWVRHRDIHLLTVGRYTYTSDQRFRAIHQPQTEDWILQIKYPQHRDSGIYECQVSTTPHMSHYILLNVVEPSTEIIGAPDLYIESGSTINLTCVILNSPEPPAYIFWNHNSAIINYDSPRGGVSVVTNKGETTTSFLLIKSARPSDSGHYQCNPSNAKSKSVTVHVLNGEFPAAMQHAALSHRRMSPSQCLLVYLSVYLCTLAYVRRFMPQLHCWAAAGAVTAGGGGTGGATTTEGI